MNVLELMAKISVDAKEFEKGLHNAGAKAAQFATKIGGGLKKAAKVGAAALATVGAGAVAAGAAIKKEVSATAEYADKIDKMSQKMGLSAEKYQEWDFIMQHSGTSMEALKAGMKTLANAAENGNEAFEKLGITQQQMASMTQEELFEATLSGLQNVENETQRTYLAGQLLGRGATELGALLNTSAKDVEAMRKQVHDLGGVMTDESVKAGAAYQDSLQNLQYAFQGVKRSFASELLQGAVKTMDGLAAVFSGNSKGLVAMNKGISEIIKKVSQKLPELIDVVSNILTSVVDSAAPVIIDGIPKILNKVIPKLIDSAAKILDELVKIVPGLLMTIVQQIPSLFRTLLDAVSNAVPMLLDALTELVDELCNFLIDEENLNMLLDTAFHIIALFGDFLVKNLPVLVKAAVGLITNLMKYMTDPKNTVAIAKGAIQIIFALTQALIEGAGELAKGAGEIVKNLIENIMNTDWKKVGQDILNSIINGWTNMKTNVKDFFSNLFSGGSKHGSHKSGLSYVPFDGYRAELHKGERVLTAPEARAYAKNGEKAGTTYNIYSSAKTVGQLAADVRTGRNMEVLFA